MPLGIDIFIYGSAQDKSRLLFISISSLLFCGIDPVKNSNSETTQITLLRDDWIKGLNKAIKYFEKPEIEQYEKCKRCLDIINHLKKDWKI